MTEPNPTDRAPSERKLLIALAVCCAGPMLAIVVLTSVIGVALHPAAAVSLGLVAAGGCIAAMVVKHPGFLRRSGHSGVVEAVDHRPARRRDDGVRAP